MTGHFTSYKIRPNHELATPRHQLVDTFMQSQYSTRLRHNDVVMAIRHATRWQSGWLRSRLQPSYRTLNQTTRHARRRA